jgi:hypothetical protein
LNLRRASCAGKKGENQKIDCSGLASWTGEDGKMRRNFYHWISGWDP